MNIMTVIQENIRILFDSKPGSRIDFSRRNFISPSSITRWCSPGLQNISFLDIIRISEYFGVTPNWFLVKHAIEARPALAEAE